LIRLPTQKGAFTSSRIPEEPKILEFNTIAFQETPTLTQYENILDELKDFCRAQGIEAIIFWEFHPSRFVNLDMDSLKKLIQVFKRSLMILFRKNYNKKWLDSSEVKDGHESLEGVFVSKSLALQKKGTSREFRVVPVSEISPRVLANLQNRAHSQAPYIDIIDIMSQRFPGFNESIVKRVLREKYGTLSDEISFTIQTSDNQSIGYILVRACTNKTGFIMDMAVDPDFQGRGLGTLLIQTVIQRYFERDDCDSIALAVTDDNKIAKNLYLKLGFKVKEKGKEGLLLV